MDMWVNVNTGFIFILVLYYSFNGLNILSYYDLYHIYLYGFSFLMEIWEDLILLLIISLSLTPYEY